MTTKPVVVGVDGSEESLLAAEWAAMEATRRSSPLLIVSAPAPMPRVHAYHASPEAIATALRGMAARALGTAVTRTEEMTPGLRIMTELLSGPPTLAVAQSGSDASMLVVGSRGAGGFTAMMLGSVSRYVASHAPCPVVVVREENMAIHREIAVGVSDPEDINDTFAFASEEAAMRGADLVAVHAWSWFPSARQGAPAGETAELTPADPERVSAEVASTLDTALADWREKYPDVRIHHDIVRGHPARVLASYSARADLVVIGRHAHPGGEAPGIGSVQHAVLDHAHGPVAIIPVTALGLAATVPCHGVLLRPDPEPGNGIRRSGSLLSRDDRGIHHAIVITVEPGAGVPGAAGQFVHAGVRYRQSLTRDTVVMTAKQQFGLMVPTLGRRHDDPDHRPGHAAAGPIGRAGHRFPASGGTGKRGRASGLAGR